MEYFKVGQKIKIKFFDQIQTPYFNLNKFFLEKIAGKYAIITKDYNGEHNHFGTKNSYRIMLLINGKKEICDIPHEWIINPIGEKIKKILKF